MYPLSHPLPLVNKGEDISMTQITKHLISMTQISNLRPEFKVSHNYFDELLGLNFWLFWKLPQDVFPSLTTVLFKSCTIVWHLNDLNLT